jgi:hypothetical protein
MVSLRLICILSIVFVSFTIRDACKAQIPGEFNRSAYIKEIKISRLEKDKEMISGIKSPIAEEEKSKFEKLHYFKPKVSFRKEARFERYDQPTRLLMKTTTDRLPEYSLYGKITFSHKGKDYSLNVYQNIELVKKPGFEKHLFIPFNDKTNGKETYGGGRFLDIYENGKETIIIDFNKAYNPYCAYNHKYSCPVPPEANNLKTSISAGEKKWHD